MKINKIDIDRRILLAKIILLIFVPSALFVNCLYIIAPTNLLVHFIRICINIFFSVLFLVLLYIKSKMPEYSYDVKIPFDEFGENFKSQKSFKKFFLIFLMFLGLLLVLIKLFTVQNFIMYFLFLFAIYNNLHLKNVFSKIQLSIHKYEKCPCENNGHHIVYKVFENDKKEIVAVDFDKQLTLNLKQYWNFFKAGALIDKGDFQKALVLLNKLEAENFDPKYEIYHFMSKCYIYLKDYPMALEYAMKAEQAGAYNYDFLVDTANTYYNMKNYNKGLEYIDRAIEEDKNNINTHIIRGFFLINVDKVDEAFELFKKIENDGKEDNIDLYLGLLICYNYKKEYDKAFSYIEKFKCEDLTFYLNAAFCCYNLQDYDNYSKYLDKAFELDKNGTAVLDFKRELEEKKKD